MKRLVFLFFGASCSFFQAQEMEVIFDRPGIADGPYIVGKKTWQLENGLAYSAGDELTSVLNPSVMLRKTIWKKQELRFTYNYVPQSSFFLQKNDSLGFIPLAIGTKINLLTERNGFPETALYANTFFPVQRLKKIGSAGIYNMEFGALFQNNFKNDFSLNYNAGFLLSNLLKKGMYSYSLCFTYSGIKRFGFFAEHFAYIERQGPSQEFSYDFGLTFNPTKHQQIDLSYVANHNRHVHYGTLLVGYSLLIKSKKREEKTSYLSE